MEAGPSRVECFEDLDLAGREVLVVDDILDQGSTVAALSAFLPGLKPAGVRWVMAFLKSGAVERCGFTPDYWGLVIPEVWVVGYGMDYNECYRNLRDLWTLEDLKALRESC
jgi:hypoxanthine phosphoribosyltransferase